MKKIRRLVLCLDGTWNNRDDSTNVLHHFSLAYECDKEERKIENGEEKAVVTQQRFYNPGVGTGPLDRITGGGFGLGLEDHVREAYNWLVQNYEDGDGPDKPADEIYIFGFSRGAYEARSLVGFISRCGLLRRGAPMTVSQLWSNYCLIGLDREERNGFWDTAFGEAKPDFREISELVWDPWFKQWNEKVPGGVPGQRLPDDQLNESEKLLIHWSRRVKITYLGVYDTVGAVGWDALAIPGLRSKLAMHNNMRPSTIIERCRHAMAIDENRSSFERTPFVAYIGPKTSKDEGARLGVTDPIAKAPVDAKLFKMRADKWENILKKWTDKIEQRWFVGAHSNIGGGYPDNRLAQRPLQWLMEGAKNSGLVAEKLPSPMPVPRAETQPRDSFADFAPPLWEYMLRAKRNYRVIDPSPELRANRTENEEDKEKEKVSKEVTITAGFSLVNINEQIDESVFDYWAGAENPSPNLVGYAVRKLASSASMESNACCAETERPPKAPLPEKAAKALQALAETKLTNPWLEKGFKPHLALIWWATFAGAGLAVTDRLFCMWPTTPPACLLAVLAAIFAFIDWGESQANFFNTTGLAKPWRRAFQDAIYWLRALGVFFFIFGAFGGLFHLWHLGWQAPSFSAAWTVSWSRIENWWCVPTGAIAGVVLGNIFNGTFGKRITTILGAAAASLLILAAIPLVIQISQGVGHVFFAVFGPPQQLANSIPPPYAAIGGLLLLLQLGFVYLANASSWNGAPMSTANLGDILPLQFAGTPGRVKACLDRWCKMLGDHHDERASECAMCNIVGQSLWRDIFGYIPVYTFVLGFGLWFGCVKLGWESHFPIPHVWLIVPIVTAVADYLEDTCHFRYLKLHCHGRQPSGLLTLASSCCTLLKFIGLLIEGVASIVALFVASWAIGTRPEDYGWRGLLALSITIVAVVAFIGVVIWSVVYRLMYPKKD